MATAPANARPQFVKPRGSPAHGAVPTRQTIVVSGIAETLPDLLRDTARAMSEGRPAGSSGFVQTEHGAVTVRNGWEPDRAFADLGLEE